MKHALFENQIDFSLPGTPISSNIVHPIPARLPGFPARDLFDSCRHYHQASSAIALCKRTSDAHRYRYLSKSNSLQPIRHTAHFHSTPRRQGLPLLQVLATLFKTSAGLELARTAGRVALTFVPILWIGRIREKRAIQHAAIHGIPVTEEKKRQHARNLRIRTRILQFLVLVPVTLFWSTILVSLERTPLTGSS